VHVVFLVLDVGSHLYHHLVDSLQDGLTYLLELLPFHIVPQILILHQALNVDLVLPVAGQNLPLPLYVLHHLQDCFLVLGQVAAR